MKLISCRLKNFASYNELEFIFENQGLVLIHGPTGSGKSTLEDAACWCLFGKTAKDGAVDEVRSWHLPDQPTFGQLIVELNTKVLTITRIRGKVNENDLYWTENNDDTKNRGKDISETQKLLNDRLGFNFDLYTTAAYFSELSSSSNFFLANAKDRRSLFEKICDLRLANTLAEKAVSHRKDAKKLYETKSKEQERVAGRAEELRRAYSRSLQNGLEWDKVHQTRISDLVIKSAGFEKEKVSRIEALRTKSKVFREEQERRSVELALKLEKLALKLEKLNSDKCVTCGRSEQDSLIDSTTYKIEALKSSLKDIESAEDPSVARLKETEEWTNPYEAQIEYEKTASNPHTANTEELKKEMEEANAKLGSYKTQIADLEHRISALTQLYDLSYDLRAALLKNSVQSVEDATNNSLERYFSSEFRVTFELDNSDNLSVLIYKNGYSCTYKQLSKGQRGLLKLCFATAIMSAAANESGISFSTLMFDEALDGLDGDLKVRSYDLFLSLLENHDSIFIIEHSEEFKSLFNKKFRVSLESDCSTIYEES